MYINEFERGSNDENIVKIVKIKKDSVKGSDKVDVVKIVEINGKIYKVWYDVCPVKCVETSGACADKPNKECEQKIKNYKNFIQLLNDLQKICGAARTETIDTDLGIEQILDCKNKQDNTSEYDL